MLVKHNTSISRMWVQIANLQTLHQTFFLELSVHPQCPCAQASFNSSTQLGPSFSHLWDLLVAFHCPLRSLPLFFTWQLPPVP